MITLQIIFGLQILIEGNFRNLSKERENRINNWYGDAINFTNKFKDIDVLDFGCGLGFYLSALNKDIKKYGVEESHFANNFIKKISQILISPEVV